MSQIKKNGFVFKIMHRLATTFVPCESNKCRGIALKIHVEENQQTITSINSSINMFMYVMSIRSDMLQLFIIEKFIIRIINSIYLRFNYKFIIIIARLLFMRIGQKLG